MAKVLKFWTGLGVAVVSGAVAVQAMPLKATSQQSHSMLLQLAATAGEAGESASTVKPVDGQAEYLAEMACVEGRMRAAIALYKQGLADAAKIHMIYPSDELYMKLQPKLQARKAVGFAEQLQDVNWGLEHEATALEVNALFAKLKTAIVAARGDGEAVSAHLMTSAAVMLLRKAADEYGLAVIGGSVQLPKEYQDAWGLVQAAKNLMEDLSAKEREEHPGPLTEIDTALANLEQLWPDLAGVKPLSADPHVLAAAAAKVELASLAIK
jgi:hypothetical protein